MPSLATVRERLHLPARVIAEPSQALVVPPVRRDLGDGLSGAITFLGGVGATTTPENPPRGFAKGGGRVTWDDVVQYMGGFQYIVPPDDYREQWRLINLDARTIQGMSPTRLLQVLADLAPDVSRALWDFIRLCNPGFECTATKPNSEAPSPEGQAILDGWLGGLRQTYGSVDVPVGRLLFGAFLRGAIMGELVLDEQARAPIDLATPDPATARFRRRLDPVRGQVWDLGQLQLGHWVLLDRPTVRYLPIDPSPGSPYGRSPAAPALFTSLFLLGLLGDLRRVVAQQGYPRYDIIVKLEELAKMAPAQIKADPTGAAYVDFVNQTIDEIARAYAALEPDSAFVHTDMVEVGKPAGAVSVDMMQGVGELIKALERLLSRALKSMPLLMGMLEGSSEANANRQWELQAAGVKSVQHLMESLLSQFGTVVLEAAGVAATCTWKFAELRAAEMYRDAMTKALLTDTATKNWLMGWDSQEVASFEATGHAPDEEEPRFIPSGQQNMEFANATASGGLPSRPGGKDNRPDGKVDNTGGDAADTGDSKDNSEQRFARSRRDFLRLSWDRPIPWGVMRGQRTLPTIKPLGSALPYIPDRVRYDDGERRRCARLFDEAVGGKYSGLLDAKVRDSEIEQRWAAA